MFKDFIEGIVQSKNKLMLLTVGIYILALIAVFSKTLLIISFIFTLLAIFLIIRKIFPIKYVLIWSFIFYFGVLNSTLRVRDTDVLLNIAPMNSEISGKIVSIPQGIVEGKPKFFFKVDKIVFDGTEIYLKNEKVLVTLNSCAKSNVSYEDLKLYNSFVFKGRLAQPFKAGNPSQFDYGNYLRNHNAYAVFYAKTFNSLSSSLTFLEKLQQNINNSREEVLKIHSKYLKSPNLEILGGIVFGDDAVSTPKDVKESFVNSGLLHILAASGMNVAFIYGFFYFILSLFKIGFKIKVALGIVMIILYSLMTGLGASIIRAALMLIFVLVGKLIDRDAHSVSLLSFVALLMLIYNPMYINDVGFQLSFIVTLGLLLMCPLVLRFDNKFIDFIASTISIPIIAQLWVIPIQIFYFNNISLYAIFANIMSVPILMVLSSGGFITSLISILIKPIADFICKWADMILNIFTTFLVNISDFWGKLPHSSIQTAHPSVLQLAIYYSIILCVTALFYKEYREKYFSKIIKIITGLIVLIILTIIPVKSSNLEIMAFDVGNADAFLVKTPLNKYIMIDTGKSGYGGGKSQAEIIFLKYFKDRGIKSLHSIIVTHFDNDHCGGTIDLIKNLDVKNLYVNDSEHNSMAARAIYQAALDKGVKLIEAEKEQVVYNEPGFKLTNFILKETSNDNENSIVTLLEYNDFNMLFTGDASVNSLQKILKYLPSNIDVLKVPHHGAIGSVNKEILQYINPKISLISVGENKFGHPSHYILELLKGTKIFRTDVNNSIKIVVRNDFKILTYDIQKRKFK